MTETEKQNEYNELIKKIGKAEKFLIDNRKNDNIENYLKKFRKALDKTNILISEIEVELGREMTDKEILLGF
jgi:hypothetical protein